MLRGVIPYPGHSQTTLFFLVTCWLRLAALCEWRAYNRRRERAPIWLVTELSSLSFGESGSINSCSIRELLPSSLILIQLYCELASTTSCGSFGKYLSRVSCSGSHTKMKWCMVSGLRWQTGQSSLVPRYLLRSSHRVYRPTRSFALTLAWSIAVLL